MTSSPKCTVLVTVTGDSRARRLIDSILSQSLPPDDIEVILVENGTRELEDLKARDRRIRYLHLEDANMAAARNAGLSVARGKFLLTTDADVVASPEWAERMVAALQEGPHAAVGGCIEKLMNATWVQRLAPTIVDGQAALNYLPALSLPYVAGANAGYDVMAVRAVGGFDERFRSGSDVDICYRLGLAGYSVGLVSEAVVFHEDRASLGAHFNRFRNYAIYQVLLFATYRPISKRRWVLNTYPFYRVAAAVSAFPRAMVALLGGKPDPTLRAVLQLVEAAGVWAGDIQGSIRYRQFYL